VITISDIKDKEFMKDMINIALETKDREWFNELTEQLNKIENDIEQENELELFNHKGCNDDLEYDYYTCQTDCNIRQVLIIIEDQIYQTITSKDDLYELDYFVQLRGNKSYKEGDMIPRSELVVYENEYDNTYKFGYFEGQIDYMNNISNFIDNKDKTIDFMDKKINLLQEYNDILKSELETFQNNYFNNKEKNKRKSKWKFWSK